MLSRLISKSSHLRILTLISSQSHYPDPNPYPLLSLVPQLISPSFYPSYRFFSSNKRGDPPPTTSNIWNLSPENEEDADSVFGGDNDGTLDGMFESGDPNSEVVKPEEEEESWLGEPAEKGGDDIFKGAESGGVEGIDGVGVGVGGDEEWATTEGYKAWSLEDGEDDGGMFNLGEEARGVEVAVGGDEGVVESGKSEQDKQFEMEEKALSAVLKGPNRAFGDLIAASGITDSMLDSLIALKDLEGIEGLPPLRELEDLRYQKNTTKNTRADIERQKQEEVAKARVREVDDKGRAYGTGKRKCSIARVWIQPGEGNFIVNDKQFDAYFPMLDHRAALLRPFSETKTLGLWDINCTVKGGGVSGQVGAVRLGISRALQNWEPDLRPPLKEAGFLTRDSRVVERKKPGKAKARKSFQWVKR
ncbi:hypothetical protein RJ639_000221 [Escallonia herrerae]|uniref:Uncharacterized protein n=1 Tax=Escallonia herrerae TaxID=1293975 RepID=A0AA89BMW7_9ASTE|nr:hypothetical protein RJ639_000221 [Escallonia herrerae]